MIFAFFAPPYQSCSEFHSIQNSGCHGNQKENLNKNILVKNSTGLIWKWLIQMVLGDPLPKLLKLIWSIEKHDHQWKGPVFHVIKKNV